MNLSAGLKKSCLSGDDQANSLATNLLRLSRTSFPDVSFFSRHVRTKRVERILWSEKFSCKSLPSSFRRSRKTPRLTGRWISTASAGASDWISSSGSSWSSCGPNGWIDELLLSFLQADLVVGVRDVVVQVHVILFQEVQVVVVELHRDVLVLVVLLKVLKLLKKIDSFLRDFKILLGLSGTGTSSSILALCLGHSALRPPCARLMSAMCPLLVFSLSSPSPLCSPFVRSLFAQCRPLSGSMVWLGPSLCQLCVHCLVFAPLCFVRLSRGLCVGFGCGFQAKSPFWNWWSTNEGRLVEGMVSEFSNSLG